MSVAGNPNARNNFSGLNIEVTGNPQSSGQAFAVLGNVSVTGNPEARDNFSGANIEVTGNPQSRNLYPAPSANISVTGDPDDRNNVSGFNREVTGNPSLRRNGLALGATQATPGKDQVATTDLLRQLETAKQSLEIQLNALRDADTAHTNQLAINNGSSKLQLLANLASQLTGGAKDVAALRGEIASAIADIRAYTSDIRSMTSTAENGTAAQSAVLHEANATAQRTVNDFTRDYYEKHVFDRYLRFGSPEDEEAYHQREEARRKAIETARAENTPEGNLKANELAIDQLKDAGVHGADRSPEYKRDLDGLTKSHVELQRAIAAMPSVNTPTQEAATGAAIDPLQSVAAKAPHAKSLAATLLAAGITPPASDNIGHGVNDRATQPSSPVRGA